MQAALGHGVGAPGVAAGVPGRPPWRKLEAYLATGLRSARGAPRCAGDAPRGALQSRPKGVHRDVLDQLTRCFIKLEASGDALRSAIRQSHSLVECPANYAFHCKVRNAFGLDVLTFIEHDCYVNLARASPMALAAYPMGTGC